ncbi:MAG: Disulfide-bond oxidoreductase YfcG [Alphaproteobacteria bacterium MarineAlpha9_Bin4]|nr:MAG: Disulfide-bond oxidoreductase YfcG [Alphaproteobacteria bacterium MarineAlpha9_Bin4]|tara:strand:- start:4249 stop:4902 length:654 start_codon:yes stop_codon:yes gene_type:complete
MIIELYTAATPNGYKVSIMLEELGIKYKVFKIDLSKGEQKEKWFLDMNPNGRIPVLKFDKKIIFESGAILYFLADKYNKFLPSEKNKRMEVMQWLMFQMSGIGPMQGQANVFYRYLDEKIPTAISRYQNECKRLYAVLDKQLEGKNWICDEYSIADIANWCWVRVYFWAGVNIDGLKNLKKWMNLMERRPACIKGVEIPKRETSKKLIKNVKKIIQT